MKKGLKIISLILVLSLLLAVPVNAEGNAEPRGSAFFGSYCTFLERGDHYSVEVWFDVDSNGRQMDEIGTTLIDLYESKDGENWTKVKIFEVENYPEMVDYNTVSHTGHVTYYASMPGYYYRAYVTFYAKNSTGIGKRFVYTGILLR